MLRAQIKPLLSPEQYIPLSEFQYSQSKILCLKSVTVQGRLSSRRWLNLNFAWFRENNLI